MFERIPKIAGVTPIVCSTCPARVMGSEGSCNPNNFYSISREGNQKTGRPLTCPLTKQDTHNSYGPDVTAQLESILRNIKS